MSRHILFFLSYGCLFRASIMRFTVTVIYVTDQSIGKILVFDRQGQFVKNIGS